MFKPSEKIKFIISDKAKFNSYDIKRRRATCNKNCLSELKEILIFLDDYSKKIKPMKEKRKKIIDDLELLLKNNPESEAAQDTIDFLVDEKITKLIEVDKILKSYSNKKRDFKENRQNLIDRMIMNNCNSKVEDKLMKFGIVF